MTPYTTYTDNELVMMLERGDRTAFETIYNRYLSVLYTSTYKRLQHKEQTEDVLQEVFARLWVKRETHHIADLKAYLHVAVRNETINFVTRSKEVFRFYEPIESILEEVDSPEGQLIAKELQSLIYVFANTLPEKRKQIFLLHIKNKLSTKEIAEELGISQKTVQNQLGTALQGLKTNLAPVIIAILATRF